MTEFAGSSASQADFKACAVKAFGADEQAHVGFLPGKGRFSTLLRIFDRAASVRCRWRDNFLTG